MGHWSAFRHYGFYGFRRDFLLQFQQLTPSKLELTEGLEQLRALQHGFRIKCPLVECETIEVNYPEDIQRLEFYLQDIRSTTSAAKQSVAHFPENLGHT